MAEAEGSGLEELIDLGVDARVVTAIGRKFFVVHCYPSRNPLVHNDLLLSCNHPFSSFVENLFAGPIRVVIPQSLSEVIVPAEPQHPKSEEEGVFITPWIT